MSRHLFGNIEHAMSKSIVLASCVCAGAGDLLCVGLQLFSCRWTECVPVTSVSRLYSAVCYSCTRKVWRPEAPALRTCTMLPRCGDVCVYRAGPGTWKDVGDMHAGT